jgi:hypothetical protein
MSVSIVYLTVVPTVVCTSSDHRANCEYTDERDTHQYSFQVFAGNQVHSEHPITGCVRLHRSIRVFILVGSNDETYG